MEPSGAWWKDPLVEEMHSTLKIKEKDIPTYYGQTPHMFARKYLVDWLSVIRENLRLLETTYHMAVYLLDYYMDEGSEIDQGRLHLTALACLVIAAKLEESSENVPSPTLLNTFIPRPTKPGLCGSYYKTDYLDMELKVLKHFKWKVMRVTTAHFVPYYGAHAVANSDLHDGIPTNSPETVTLLRMYLDNFINYFQDISLQYDVFRNYRPSVMAASCVASSRVCLHLTPTWPKRLDSVTDCCLEELMSCVHNMLRIHETDMKSQSSQ